MSQNTQSKILSIDEQIQKLKEKRSREVAKLERSAGKRLIEKFNLENKSIDEIYLFIESIQDQSEEIENVNSVSYLKNEQFNQ
ncbi:hypothetical protein MPH61_23405 [Peribacillus muralis]|uniref:hypothetical protein n=1 Tax=Peribacillus muralis TaxID=264697 RepID=UPI001F4E1D8F|nr:hypothetical protein [Peribacillus muralis]MCK1995473.1 hypothetical protein [Peribacillus muralis]MCK2016056.1 hypothetical protein [Peribacillus muralis]